MKYELWYSDAEHSGVLLAAADASSETLKPRDARVIWSVDAETYAEAVRQREEFLASCERAGTVTAVRREPSTTRFTMAAYRDRDGQQRSITAPGWVGMVQAFAQANVDFSEILGQMYFERPGLDAPLDTGEFLSGLPALGVKEITVVDLRSADGTERMCQEFHGRIEDVPRIRFLVWQRLGADMPQWNIVYSYVLQGKTPAALP
jgi:hypothetical protein